MDAITLILLIIGLVLFLIAGAGIAAGRIINLVAFGLAAWITTVIIHTPLVNR